MGSEVGELRLGCFLFLPFINGYHDQVIGTSLELD